MKRLMVILGFAVVPALLLHVRCAPTGPGPDGSGHGSDNNGVDGGGDGADNSGADDTPIDDPLPDYVVDPAIYTATVDAARLVTLESETGDAADVQFPVDQLMLLMAEGTYRTDAEALAVLLDGEIVGQVPDMGLYQIRVPSDTRAELDAAMALAAAQPPVEAAFYNLLLQTTQCPARSDLYEQLILEEERCPFMDIDYYSALTIVDHIRPQLALHPVVVAVIDSGIQQDNGEFDEARIVNLSDPRARCTGRDPHGTAVSSVIAADDDGAGMNGLASRMLDNFMVLLEDVTTSTDFASYYASAGRALQAGAEVVNMSFGSPASLAGVRLPGIRSSWQRMFAANPDTLFVVAADNRSYEITETNYAPAGIDLPNVITVGGTNVCAPEEAYPESAFGPRIDIAAPAVFVPVASFDNGHEITPVTGNSVAAPIVASLAAILKAIDGGLSPREIKEDYILRYGAPAPLPVGGMRVYYSPTILQALIDRMPSVPTAVLDLIDGDTNGRHDPPGLVINRICGGLQYAVSGYGSYDYSAQEVGGSSTSIVGEIAPMAFSLHSYVGPDAYLLLGCTEGFECTFELGKAYPIHEDALDLPGYVAITYTVHPEEDVPEAIGLGLSGSVLFESCRIDQRFPLDNRILEISVTGQFSGSLRVVNIPSDSVSYETLEGYFSLPFITLGLSPDEPVYQYIEDNCEGGYPAPP